MVDYLLNGPTTFNIEAKERQGSTGYSYYVVQNILDLTKASQIGGVTSLSQVIICYYYISNIGCTSSLACYNILDYICTIAKHTLSILK